MFCFSVQETAQGKGCTVRGVCGKEPQTAALMDLLFYAVRGVVMCFTGEGICRFGIGVYLLLISI